MARGKPVWDDDGRVCTGCGKYRLWKEFDDCETCFHGKKPRCKACIKEYNKTRRRRRYTLLGEAEVNPKRDSVFMVQCKNCEHESECRERVRQGLHLKCERPDKMDLLREQYPERMYWNE